MNMYKSCRKTMEFTSSKPNLSSKYQLVYVKSKDKIFEKSNFKVKVTR